MPQATTATVVAALAAALLLAVVAAHPRVRALEARLGLTIFAGLGLPFVLLGAFFGIDAVGVLSEATLSDLHPVFEFGLGWIGFSVGLRFDLRAARFMPRGLGALVAAQTLLPMLTTAAVCLPLLYLLDVPRGGGLLRNVLVFVACAAASAPIAGRLASDAKQDDLTRRAVGFDEVAALATLALVTVFFRPDAALVRWNLPPAGWGLVTLGLGVVAGLLTFALAKIARDDGEELALLIGAVALTAGLAGYLAISVPVVCACAGAFAINLPGLDRERVRRLFHGIEQPLYLLLLLIVGAAWRPDAWQGWVLAVAFVAARVYGKSLGARLARRLAPAGLPDLRTLTLAILPQGPVAIVVIASAATLHGAAPPPAVRWAINAVLVGSVLTEVVIRVLEGRAARDVARADAAVRSAS